MPPIAAVAVVSCMKCDCQSQIHERAKAGPLSARRVLHTVKHCVIVLCSDWWNNSHEEATFILRLFRRLKQISVGGFLSPPWDHILLLLWNPFTCSGGREVVTIGLNPFYYCAQSGPLMPRLAASLYCRGSYKATESTEPVRRCEIKWRLHVVTPVLWWQVEASDLFAPLPHSWWRLMDAKVTFDGCIQSS